MNEHETSAAIADETVIDAIEGAQAVDAVTADESSNPIHLQKSNPAGRKGIY